MLTGQTFFKGMRYESLHRLQLDIETLTLDPADSGAAVILVALSDSRGYEEVLGGPGFLRPTCLRPPRKGLWNETRT